MAKITTPIQSSVPPSLQTVNQSSGANPTSSQPKQLVEETTVAPTARVPFADTAVGKMVQVALWSGASAFLGGVILWLSGDFTLALFKVMVLIPTVNTIAVTLKSLVDPHVPNLPR